MGLYYFHIRGNGTDFPDDDGMELPDAEAAREQALIGARGILAAEVLEGRLPLDDRIEVEDEHGRLVLSLSFREAVGLPG